VRRRMLRRRRVVHDEGRLLHPDVALRPRLRLVDLRAAAALIVSRARPRISSRGEGSQKDQKIGRSELKHHPS
jgi:hypothetical protein